MHTSISLKENLIMSNEHYVVDLIGNSGPLCDLEMMSRDLLHDGDLELYCSCVFHFNVDDSLMYDYAQRFNKRYDNTLSDRGYVEFDIETEISVITSYREIEQNRLDLMIVLLSYCRLQRCIDKFGNVHDVSSTEFARGFNTLFSSMISDFEDTCDFRVTRVERRI